MVMLWQGSALQVRRRPKKQYQAEDMAASGRYLVLITGASRGFGRHLAVEFVRAVRGKAVDLHLVARTQAGLAATQTAVESLGAEQQRKDVKVWQWPMDLGDLDQVGPRLREVFSQIEPAAYERAFLFNNAGAVWPLTFTQELGDDLVSLRRAVDMNVTSFMYLTGLFVKAFGAPRPDLPHDQLRPGQLSAFAGRAVVVNVSSLAAIQAFPSWGAYCTGKAGRDMFLQVVAKEQEHSDRLKCLNYAPGPMDTEMQADVRAAPDTDRVSKQWFIDMHQQGKLVCPQESAAKCVRLLLADRYSSAQHIDFYDMEP